MPFDAQRGIGELIHQHYRLVYRYAYRLSGSASDAEDLTQQTFLIAHEKLGQLKEPAAAAGWLCTIVRHAFLKGQKPGPRMVVLDVALDLAEVLPAPAEIDSDDLQAALHELPEEFRTPLILFYFQDFSYKDIAAQLGVPIGTVMSRLARGKAHLRRRLSEEPLPERLETPRQLVKVAP